MLAALNGVIFALLACVVAFNSGLGIVLAVFAGLSAAFWLALWFAGRNEIRPLIAAFVLALGAVLWSFSGASFGIMEGGLILFPFLFLVLAYLGIGVIVSVSLHRENRAKRKQETPSLLERKARG